MSETIAVEKLTMEAFLRAVEAHGQEGCHHLIDQGYPPKVVYDRAKRAASKGYYEYGVSIPFRGCPGLKAEIRRTGRWSWTLHITDGPSIIGDPMWGSPRAFGSRGHAERKARKIMAKVAAWHDQERHTVTSDDG